MSQLEKKKRKRRSPEKMIELVLEASVGAGLVCRRDGFAWAQLSGGKEVFAIGHRRPQRSKARFKIEIRTCSRKTQSGNRMPRMSPHRNAHSF